MGNKITFDYSKAAGFVNEGEVKIMEKLAADAKETLLSGNGAGNDFCLLYTSDAADEL